MWEAKYDLSVQARIKPLIKVPSTSLPAFLFLHFSLSSAIFSSIRRWACATRLHICILNSSGGMDIRLTIMRSVYTITLYPKQISFRLVFFFVVVLWSRNIPLYALNYLTRRLASIERRFDPPLILSLSLSSCLSYTSWTIILIRLVFVLRHPSLSDGWSIVMYWGSIAKRYQSRHVYKIFNDRINNRLLLPLSLSLSLVSSQILFVCLPASVDMSRNQNFS
jgi:hypothetical protein